MPIPRNKLGCRFGGVGCAMYRQAAYEHEEATNQPYLVTPPEGPCLACRDLTIDESWFTINGLEDDAKEGMLGNSWLMQIGALVWAFGPLAIATYFVIREYMGPSVHPLTYVLNFIGIAVAWAIGILFFQNVGRNEGQAEPPAKGT